MVGTPAMMDCALRAEFCRHGHRPLSVFNSSYVVDYIAGQLGRCKPGLVYSPFGWTVGVLRCHALGVWHRTTVSSFPPVPQRRWLAVFFL